MIFLCLTEKDTHLLLFFNSITQKAYPIQNLEPYWFLISGLLSCNIPRCQFKVTISQHSFKHAAIKHTKLHHISVQKYLQLCMDLSSHLLGVSAWHLINLPSLWRWLKPRIWSLWRREI